MRFLLQPAISQKSAAAESRLRYPRGLGARSQQRSRRGLGGLLIGERQVLIVEDFVEYEEIRCKDEVRQLNRLIRLNIVHST